MTYVPRRLCSFENDNCASVTVVVAAVRSPLYSDSANQKVRPGVIDLEREFLRTRKINLSTQVGCRQTPNDLPVIGSLGVFKLSGWIR